MTHDLFAMIESPAFSARLNVVSGYAQFVRALGSQPEIRELRSGVNSVEDASELRHRISSLASAPHDPAYENPHDVALAAYLWVLSMCAPDIAQLAAETILAQPSWWARKVAEKVVADTNTGAGIEATKANTM
jgi:hypothetical protein